MFEKALLYGIAVFVNLDVFRCILIGVNSE